MSGALEIAAIGLRAQQRALETIAGNISNVNTPAFKRSGLRFSELVSGPIDTAQPAGADVIPVVGVGQSSRPMVDELGKIEATGSERDLAIDGSGFIELMGPAGRTLLWRGGTFHVLQDGMLATSSGVALKAGIVVPTDVASLRIDRDGTVHATGADGQATEIGKLDLVKVRDEVAIQRLDSGIYAVADDADIVSAGAGEEGLGYFVQGSIERSNVDLNEEMVGLLIAQRAYAANAQVVRAVDEFLSLANGLRRA